MTHLKITAALAAALTLAAAPYALAEQGTTMGGSAKDNSASGGSEASGTSKAGAAPSSGAAVKKSGSMTGAAHKSEPGK